MMKSSAAMNKNPAPIQTTAAQILRESRERQAKTEIRPPKQKIIDSAELSDYRLRRRKEFEDQISGVRCLNTRAWVRYADWEESQSDYARARSVWERVLAGASRNHPLWVRYAEFEMRNGFVDNARNVWDRAVMFLPRVDQIWEKYVRMEETLGNTVEARRVYQQWMDWSPDQHAWLCFIRFELRFNEIERARSIYERFVLCHPKASAWVRFAKFEIKCGEVTRARTVFERAMESLKGVDEEEEAKILSVAFAEFEEPAARFLDHNPKGRADDLTRFEYEDEVRKNPLNYDSWFGYIRFEETLKNKDRIREIYERAIANVPPAQEKRYWKRYIYLWIGYALYEEVEAEDVERTRAVYMKCLKLIPHAKFSFAKIWLLFAKFEIRQLNLAGARRVLGTAIGRAPSEKIFKEYIEMELDLGNIDRCRKIYFGYLNWSPKNCYTWIKYAELERSLGEMERARAILEVAVGRPALDMPEVAWKAYIDFEISRGKPERARALYERLLDKTKNYKVWVSFAKFEACAAEEKGEEDSVVMERARAVFERGNAYYKECRPELKDERAALLEEWLNMEKSFGLLRDSQSKLPKKVKKRRALSNLDGSTKYVEFVDYVFPEDPHAVDFKILEVAYNWKKQKLAVF